jgi:hypothetical protein
LEGGRLMASTRGRQVVVPLQNKSGGAVAAGDVVVVDTGNNDAFTTTTSAGFTGGIGVVQEAIANNATGRVLVSGYAALVNVNASVTRGNFGATHTVAKQAAGSGSRGAGTFCQFLTGGATPDAIVYPADLAAAALTDPMTTRGDIIIRNAANATARLGRGSAGTVLTSDGTDVAWGAAAAGALVLLEQHTASTSATLDFTTCISATYDEYLIEFVGIVPVSAADLWMRMSTDGGATYDATGIYSYDHQLWRAGGVGNSGTSAQTKTLVSYSGGGSVSTSTTHGLNGNIRLYSPGSTVLYKTVRGQVAYQESSGSFRVGVNYRGAYESATAVNAFRFLMSTGNIASGTIRVYGIAK